MTGAKAASTPPWHAAVWSARTQRYETIELEPAADHGGSFAWGNAGETLHVFDDGRVLPVAVYVGYRIGTLTPVGPSTRLDTTAQIGTPRPDVEGGA
jgi:hypothetical protein